jgi:hypothetical protein
MCAVRIAYSIGRNNIGRPATDAEVAAAKVAKEARKAARATRAPEE